MSITAIKPNTAWGRAAAYGIAGSLVVGLVVLAFLWPSKATSPHNLPVSIVGPEAAVTAVKGALETASPDAFDFVDAADREEAETQIKQRDTYGAIVLATPPQTPEVLTAPAGSAVATQMLTGLAAQLEGQAKSATAAQVTTQGGDEAAAAAVTVTVTAVVPLVDSDPTGSGLAAASFPLMMGGMIGGIIVSLLVTGAARRVAALAGFGVAAGLVLSFIMHTWFEYLPGSFGQLWLVMGASVVATSAFIAGCATFFGKAGIGIGAITTMLIANPIAAAATPWQFLPSPWGAIGQWFVPGAANSLMRGTAYFPDASMSHEWLVLGGWIALGLVLIALGGLRTRAAVDRAAGSAPSTPATTVTA